MYTDKGLYIAKAAGRELYILPKMANRHGLIAGATGTGKTVSLKVLAESFSDMGVPVIMADVKGDLAGMVKAGGDNATISQRVSEFGLLERGFTYKAFPTCFWDLFAKKGLPLRTTISEFGPLLLAKLLDLNQVQSDILNIVFKIADDEGLLLIDIKDLKAMLNYVSENSAQYKSEYGNISSQSVAAIMRAVVALSDRGAEEFFGEPALNIRDWMRTTQDSRAYINIIDASSLIQDTLAYSTFMLWLLSELFETMPEVGDLEKPKMVFFFDEAHLLFKNTPKAMMQKIEQVMKLIRSKGIGIYFISQSPSDIPGEILAQLGNKIQHALRAYTASEQKAVKAAAQSYRINPNLDTQKAITELGIGEDFSFKAYPTVFWDIFGKKGLPLRTTISEFGPMLLAKLLDLNQIQTDILNIIFKIADDEGLLLIDLKDLKSMLNYVSENAADYKAEYGNIAPQSVNAIMRGLVALGDKGGDIFFGEPALDINDWFVTKDGKGMINVLDATTIINDPVIYSTFMLWMLAELFEIMPEVGDLDKPKMVFFFDEAHLLFKDTPKALLQKIEQVVKLIRSKGIGVYFITQNPLPIIRSGFIEVWLFRNDD